METTSVIGLFAAGVAGLWWALRSSYDARLSDKDQTIAQLTRERDDARKEARDANDALALNTEALQRITPVLERLQRPKAGPAEE